MKTIGIVGAGVMGRTLAWRLLADAKRSGLKVTLTLFDKDPIEYGEAAAFTAAGMLTPYCELESAEHIIFEMGLHSLSLWPQLVASLEQDLDFHQAGSVVVAHRNDHVDYLRFSQQLEAKLKTDEQQHYRHLNHQQLQAQVPALTQNFSQGLFIPDESWLDTELYMQAVANKLLGSGVNWLSECAVLEIGELEHSAFVVTEDCRHTFDQVIDCRGLQAKDDIADLRGVRGEVITLHAPAVAISKMVRLMHPRYRLYLVPRKNDVYLLGATQIESEDYGPITVRSTLELLSAVYSIDSGFAEASVLKTDVNCRPALKNNLPRIETGKHLMRINGLYRHGFLLAPTLAEEASNKILQLGKPASYQQVFSELMQ